MRQVIGKIVVRWDCNVARWCAGGEYHKRILECKFVPNFKRYFYFKYRPCISVKFEIEGGLKQGFRKAATKLGFV
ncbi:hypothetical protein MtrunA17_Chr1g0150681 [Medicago truncatula]|uniref:Uncharacterized protein n=1 Tax=Medicago truncatula TaxID=3880 RepID=A0A396JID5_MEDTR|nr:hypothetical protein MtrunA17_Chr1g0150681 [Medicago truncatula]